MTASDHMQLYDSSMSNSTAKVTARGLIDFLDTASKRGFLVQRTAEAYKTAATKILKIDGESWEETELRSLDLDTQVDRFVRLEGSGFKPETLRTYESRFRSAVAECLKYEEDPRSYRGPAAQRRSVPRKSGKGGVAASESGAVGDTSDTAEADGHRGDGGPPARPSLVKYPFPLRSGELAYFELPRDLTRAEAQRMAAFISSLAIDPVPELKSGRNDET